MCDMFGCVIVSQDEVKVVEQLGKYMMVARPGLNCILPCLCQFVKGTLSMRLMQMDITCETKTKDNVFVTLKVAVQYQVNPDTDSIKDAMYKLTNARAQIESYVYDGEPGFPCPQFARLICLRKQLMMVASAPRREQLCGQQCPRLSLTMCSRQRTRSLAQSSHN